MYSNTKKSSQNLNSNLHPDKIIPASQYKTNLKKRDSKEDQLSEQEKKSKFYLNIDQIFNERSPVNAANISKKKSDNEL